MGLCLQYLPQSSWNPCDFPSCKNTGNISCSTICPWPCPWPKSPKSFDENTRSIFCFFEVTLGQLLDGSWMRAGHRTKSWLKAWNFYPCPHPPKWGEGLEMELAIDCAYKRKPPQNPNIKGSGNFQDGEYVHMGRLVPPNSMGTETLAFRTLLGLCICSSISFITSFNKLINVFSWVLWPTP